MAHLIDKDALVAKIERLACQEHNSFCDKLLDFLDTLEVKDLELDWKDIETIGKLRLNVALELRKKELESSIKAPLKFTTEDMCKEVLKRFKEWKEIKD